MHPLLQPIGSLSTTFAITGLLNKATAPRIGKVFFAASLKNSLLVFKSLFFMDAFLKCYLWNCSVKECHINICSFRCNVLNMCQCSPRNNLFDTQFHIRNTLLCICQYRHQYIYQSSYCNSYSCSSLRRFPRLSQSKDCPSKPRHR